jgi:hypothetical protein
MAAGSSTPSPKRPHQAKMPAWPFSNRFLLGGIAFSLAFAMALVYVPPLHSVFGTAALSPAQLATVAPFPFIVWGADELRRLLVRHFRTARPAA